MNDKHYTPQRAAAREQRRLAKALDPKYMPVQVDGRQVWVFAWDEVTP